MTSVRLAPWYGPGLVLLALLSGCSGDGTVRAGTLPATPSVPPGAGGHRQGDCLDGEREETPVRVSCETPHRYEVTVAEYVPAGTPDAFPPVMPTARPACHGALPTYLGSPEAVASRMESLYFHSTREQWDRGDRWFVCLVGEEGPEGDSIRRTGSLRGVLADGLGSFRRCLTGASIQDEQSLIVPCEQPHRSEAIGVLVLGSRTDPPPDSDVVVNRLIPHCEAALTDYLGGVTKPGVRTSGWASVAEAWENGATTAICYAVTDTPITGSVRDL